MRKDREMLRRLMVFALTTTLVAGLSPSARAQETPETVTLEADKAVVDWGTKVQLEGKVSSGDEGHEVQIVDQDGGVVAEATTKAGGGYQTSYVPGRSATLRAQWLETQSDTVRVAVKPLVKVNLYHVRLFGRARVTGNVQPAITGQKVIVKLRRNGKVVAKKRVTTSSGRYFKARFRIRKPGKYSVRAQAVPPDMKPAGASTGALQTDLPTLRQGARGLHVKLLEWRLRDLGYYLPSANRTYDEKTRDALIAFSKVQRIERTGSAVTADTWRRLASSVRPKPRVKSDFHIEIDQTRQVIFVVKNDKVKWILHTSTGKASTPTRDGTWRVHSKLAGYSRKRLYYPSFFDGARAIHGWPEVPTYPASHGCSRVPMWSAQWIYGIAEMGTTVRVYH